jgi:DNA-binding NarL/FixJ family response regulator
VPTIASRCDISDFSVGLGAIQNSDTSIQVLLADDSEIVRRAIRQVLATQSEIEIVGEAADFGQTVMMANNLKPQVIVLDLRMPDDTKIASQNLKSHLNHRAQILAISFSIGEESKELAENLGAEMLLDKMDLNDTLIPAILQLRQKRIAAA